MTAVEQDSSSMRRALVSVRGASDMVGSRSGRGSMLTIDGEVRGILCRDETEQTAVSQRGDIGEDCIRIYILGLTNRA